MDGINFNGVLFFGVVDHEGRKYASIYAPVDGDAIKVTEGGNDLLAYAKIPNGKATVQITAWTEGSTAARAAAKVAKKVAKVKVAPKVELVKNR